MNDILHQPVRTPDGLALACDVSGDPQAPAVILLHGGGQTRHSWAATVKQLVANGYRVVNYDARGHGDSDWSPEGDYSIEALTSDLRTVRNLVPGPAAFVGASMGGITSFFTVGTSDEPIADALVMVDIVLRVAPAGVNKIQQFMRGNQNGFANLEEATAAVAAYNPDRPRPSDSAGLLKNLRLRDDGRLYWHWDPRLMEMKPSSEPPSRLDTLVASSKGVSIPTLVVRGQHSDIVDDEGVAEMRRLVPQTEVLEVRGAGHMIAGDRNDAFTAGIMAFLDRHFRAV